ncbi:MAG: tRNA (adenosine(37)-N6)-threonylcarbamoyltransferase complex dimerization subunit type 1 TsaB [Actinomycetota bacterium]|nr:tRNA (adenosine(37)-N6)-threonylcarbamoyltransferase complex dimerization subunit type 1 TsaB [Actinomycetota bacterium]
MDRVLGFDTSTGLLTVAVTAGEQVLEERAVEPDPSGRPRHARELLVAVEDVLSGSGGWDGLGKIAVGLGPGTFTGLRIGIATARSLAQARGIPVVGISSLRALAANATARRVLAVLDAKRTEAFAALYESDGREIWEPWVGSPQGLAKRVTKEAEPPLAIGDGAVRFREELEASGAEVPADEDSLHRLRARHVCLIATETAAGPLEQIKPTYLRRPDAELWRERNRRPTGGR